MGRITQELLRKRAEHNEGILSTMEEISLHQLSIEKIENLEYYCRHLKILYLQDNIIEKLENLDKLKELEYLNMAVNSISVIEGLENCESLNKLDMTMNFVDIENLKDSVDCLSKVHSLREIYLTGNPCEKFKYCKEYVIARCPQITLYNGNEIVKSERIKASQMLPMIEKELEKSSREHIIFKQNDPNEKNPNHYSVEYRRKLYKDLERDKENREKEKAEEQKKGSLWEDSKKEEIPSVYKPNGEIRIVNKGNYEFHCEEDIIKTAQMTFTIKIPKFMDTNKIKVDLQPQYIRLDINGKITQWKFEHEIIVEKAIVERSTTTGVLEVRAPILGFKPRKNFKIKEEKKDKFEEEKKKELEKKKNLKSIKAGVDFGKIEDSGIKEVEKFEKDKKSIEEISKECGVDLDEIPDLE